MRRGLRGALVGRGDVVVHRIEGHLRVHACSPRILGLEGVSVSKSFQAPLEFADEEVTRRELLAELLGGGDHAGLDVALELGDALRSLIPHLVEVRLEAARHAALEVVDMAHDLHLDLLLDLGP